MLADHVGMHVLRIDVEMPAYERPESRGIQRRARPEDARVRHAEVGGEMRRQVRHDVHGIGHDEKHRVRSGAEHRRHDLPEHVSVALQQLQARFARSLCHPAGDDDDARSVEVPVLPRTDG